jgi:hypothetical protein
VAAACGNCNSGVCTLIASLISGKCRLLNRDVQALQHRGPKLAHLVVTPLDRIGYLLADVRKLWPFQE